MSNQYPAIYIIYIIYIYTLSPSLEAWRGGGMMTHAQWPLFILQTKQRPSQLMYTRVLYKATPPPGHDSHLFILVPFTKLSYSCEVPFYSHWSIILSVISSFIFRSFLLCFARYTISSKGFTPYGDSRKSWTTSGQQVIDYTHVYRTYIYCICILFVNNIQLYVYRTFTIKCLW